MEVKLYTIVIDWFKETFPLHQINDDFMPYSLGAKIVGIGKVIKMDGIWICRVADSELIPYIDHFSVGTLNAADPEFFTKIENWVNSDIIPHLQSRYR